MTAQEKGTGAGMAGAGAPHWGGPTVSVNRVEGGDRPIVGRRQWFGVGVLTRALASR